MQKQEYMLSKDMGKNSIIQHPNVSPINIRPWSESDSQRNVSEKQKTLLKASIKSPFVGYAYVVANDEQLDYALMNLSVLATLGLALHISSKDYKTYQIQQGKIRARQWIKQVTAHNSKLGLNWSVPFKQYMVSISLHPKTSTYSTFIETAGAKHGDSDWAKHLKNQKLSFVTDVSDMPNQMPSDQKINPPDKNRDGKYVVNGLDDMYVKGLEEQIEQTERQLNELRSQQEKFQDAIPVKFHQLQRAFSKLPQALALIHDEMHPGAELSYAKSMLNPFDPSLTGLRIPTLSPDSTIAIKDYQTLSQLQTTKTLFIYNPTALNTSPLLVISSNLLPDFNNAVPATQSITYVGQQPDVAVQVLAVYNTGLTGAQVKAASKVYNLIDNRPNYDSIRLVSAGLRVIKTSRSDNESGMLTAMYSQRGLAVNKSIRNAIVDAPSRENCRIPIASTNTNTSQTGILMQVAYRPRDNKDCEYFSDSFQQFMGEEYQVQEGVDILQMKDNYWGPVQWYADTNNNSVFAPVINWNDIANRTNFSIAAVDLQRKHVCVGMVEDAQNITLEFEMIRHMEAISSDVAQHLERKSELLSPEYSSPLDILRKLPLSQIIRPRFSTLTEDELYLTGLWDLPFISKAADLAKRGLLSVMRMPAAKDLMIQAAPTLASFLLRRVPGLDLVEPVITNAVKNVAQTLVQTGQDTLEKDEQEMKKQYKPNDNLLHQDYQVNGMINTHSYQYNNYNGNNERNDRLINEKNDQIMESHSDQFNYMDTNSEY